MAKILIAEDDLSSQVIVKTFIEQMGHIAFVSPTGKHALEALIANPDIALVVSDVMMPEMDGRELVVAIRKNDKIKNKPVIMVSGVIGVSEISGLLTLGVTFFLPKPVNKSDLSEYVERALASAAAASSSAPRS